MTAYCVRYRIHRTGAEAVARFDNAMARAIFIISYAPYADVVAQREEAHAS